MLLTLSSVWENQACQEQCQKHHFAAVITTYPEGRLSDDRGTRKEIAVPVETLSSSPRWSITNNTGSLQRTTRTSPLSTTGASGGLWSHLGLAGSLQERYKSHKLEPCTSIVPAPTATSLLTSIFEFHLGWGLEPAPSECIFVENGKR